MDLSKLESGRRVLHEREVELTDRHSYFRFGIVKHFIHSQQSRSTFEPDDDNYSETAMVPVKPVETARGQREARLFLWASNLTCAEGVKVHLDIGPFEIPTMDMTRKYLGTVKEPLGVRDSGLRHQEVQTDPLRMLAVDERILIDGLLFEAAEVAGYDPFRI